MKREIKSSTGLLIVFAFAVVIFGGAYTYANLFINKLIITESSNYIPVRNVATKDWRTFEIKTLGLSFKYPKEWGSASIDNGKTKVESGYSYNITFTGSSKFLAGFTSTDMVAGREGRFYEMININKNVSKIKNCANFESNMGKENLTKCTNVEKAGKVTGMVVVYDFPDEAMVSGSNTIAYYFTDNKQFPVVGFETYQKSSKISADFENIIKSFFSSGSASVSTATTPTTTQTDAADWKAYVNSTYGFGLTFTDPWKGYKLKAVDLEGTVKTFYVNVPTTDSLHASETSTAYAGYAAPFAIGVIEKSKWQDDELFARDFGSKVGEKGDYVFTSSRWQACPTDLCSGGISSSLKAVMDSFQVL